MVVAIQSSRYYKNWFITESMQQNQIQAKIHTLTQAARHFENVLQNLLKKEARNLKGQQIEKQFIHQPFQDSIFQPLNESPNTCEANSTLDKLDEMDSYFEQIKQTSQMNFSDALAKITDVSKPPKKYVETIFSKHIQAQKSRISARNSQILSKQGFKQQLITPQVVKYTQNHIIKKQEIELLKDNRDLNDTILNLFYDVIHTHQIDEELAPKCYYFNTYFFARIIQDSNKILIDHQKSQEDLKAIEIFNKSVETKCMVIRKQLKIDLFTKSYITIPVHLDGHWFVIMVINLDRLSSSETLPNRMPCILYMDSLKTMNQFIVRAVRIYLNVVGSILVTEHNLPAYQLILPKQNNYHDCGIYSLCYIEMLLTNPEQLELDFSYPPNRIKLNLFPRYLIFTMRMRIKKLIYDLNSDFKNALHNYVARRREILNQTYDQEDYDEIDPYQFRKWICVNRKPKPVPNSEQEYQQLLLFYLSPDCNYFGS